MDQYINKSAVMAEIEKRIADNKKDIERASHKNLEDYFEGYEDALALLKQQYLDTLETKEVDLEKEIDDYINDKFSEASDGCILSDAHKDMGGVTYTDLSGIAKHFFKLGLLHSTDETVVRKIINLYLEAGKHLDETIKQERENNGSSQLAIDLLNGVKDAKEMCIQYVLNKFKDKL